MNSGYYMVGLFDFNGDYKRILLHRLLYETFKETINEGWTINHIDNNKLNNSLNNLEQMTLQDNIKTFVNTIVRKKIKGFKQIKGFDNYYINRDGIILSFKQNKTEGKIRLLTKKDIYICLNQDKKTHFIKVQNLINTTFKK